MVSLSIEQGQGGYFFGHQESAPASIPTQRDVDLTHDTLSIHAGLVTEPHFHRIPTVWVAVLLLFILVAYAVMLFVFGDHALNVDFRIGGTTDPPFDFMVLVHVGIWLIVFVADRHLQHVHHISQGLGYLQMFRETKEIRRLPYNILCLGNAVLLVIVIVLDHTTKSSHMGLHLINILQIVFIMELIIILPGITWYLVKVVKFNRAKQSPDAEDTDFLNGFAATGMSQSLSETGFRDGEYLDEILEKQADMIRYLQQHNANLGRRLMKVMQLQQAQQQKSRSYSQSAHNGTGRLERTITS